MSVDTNTSSIEGMIQEARSGKLSRRGFMAVLSAAGVSATGLSVLSAVTSAHASQARPAMNGSEEAANLAAHDNHLSAQTGAQTGAAAGAQSGGSQWVVSDYHPGAVVEDVGSGSVSGHAAIVARKQAQAAAISHPVIKVLNRIPFGSQVVAEWEFVGTHAGPYLGFAPTGRTVTLHGVTVVTRTGGKISKESIYYDPAELQSQLGTVAG